MVSYTALLAAAATLMTGTNAVIVSFYSDQNCQNMYNSRNIYDNTCATGVGGYQSFIITTGSTDAGQQVSAFSRDACAGDVTACVASNQLNRCITAVNGNGGSNAISSSTGCGLA